MLTILIISGCMQQDDPPAATETAPSLTLERRLRISATVDEELGFTTISADKLPGNLSEALSYLDLKDVAIEIEGTHYPLEYALQEGLYSVEEIFADARLDARNQLCTEKFETNNGLTRFAYCYPEYYLYLVYDVFVSPDGESHLISSLTLTKPSSNISTIYIDDETGIPLGREDWGLTFEVLDTCSTGMTLSCHQSGGQQIGQLSAQWYYLNTTDETTAAQLQSVSVTDCDAPITMDAETVLTLDWSESYGMLPSGEYTLWVMVYDKFNPEQVHPLMQDYFTNQGYPIEFSIP